MWFIEKNIVELFSLKIWIVIKYTVKCRFLLLLYTTQWTYILAWVIPHLFLTTYASKDSLIPSV